jgi:leader peptidase (prepilin peptidase)/N-methyltransferase
MVQAVIFGILGFLTCILLEKLYISVTKKKCKVHEIVIDMSKLDIKFKIVLYVLNTLLWAASGLQVNDIFLALLISLMFSLAILTGMIDLRIHIIPNEFVLAMLGIGVLLQIKNSNVRAFLTAFACMVGMAALFLIVAKVMGMRKVGAGDVKLAGAMGFALGYPDILPALLVMSVVMLLFSIIGIFTYKLTLKSALPLAPFLMIGMTAGFLSNILT